jgi:hypothetical protein
MTLRSMTTWIGSPIRPNAHTTLLKPRPVPVAVSVRVNAAFVLDRWVTGAGWKVVVVDMSVFDSCRCYLDAPVCVIEVTNEICER